ncbi:hypothetical protein BN903_9 [Halorubrum sp. AJ67]|nr:hypothetical protein BN903_9 [Halorubrum sp. AJ67]
MWLSCWNRSARLFFPPRALNNVVTDNDVSDRMLSVEPSVYVELFATHYTLT